MHTRMLSRCHVARCHVLLSFVLACRFMRQHYPHNATHTTPHYIITPFLVACTLTTLLLAAIPYLYIVSARYLLPTYYLPRKPKRSNDRITPFHANCLRFRALSVWGVSLFPTRPSSAALSRYFFIFIFSYSAIFISPLLSNNFFLFFFYINYPIIPHALFIFPCTFPFATYRCRYFLIYII